MVSKNLRAILGPTNTGKTYFAIERMLAHSSGIMCFPLRLLARENYDKIIKVVEKNKVAFSLLKLIYFLAMIMNEKTK